MDPVYKGGPPGESSPPASNLGGSSAAAFEGELSFFSLPELIQLVCTGGHDSEIDILVDGARAGSLIIRGGRVFRCTSGSVSGEPAFFQLARLRSGRFQVTPLPSEGAHDASLFNYSWQELLLEAARREDEAKRAAAGDADAEDSKPPEASYVDLFNSAPLPPPPPPAPSQPALSQPPLSLQPPSLRDPDKGAGTRFAELIQDATAAYLRRDYERALLLFEECLTIDPHDRRVHHNIERIKNRRSRA